MKDCLSIIIPVYNEQETIISILDKAVNAPLSISKELIIVNDGSSDDSELLIRNWLKKSLPEYLTAELINKENGGKGSAVRAGINRSSGSIVIIQDADLEYDPNDYQTCIDPIVNGKADVVYGSRERLSLNRSHSSWLFYAGGLTVSYWMNLLYGSSMTDEPTCYKTFKGDLIRAIPFKQNGFGWEPEITAKLLRLGYDIAEVPISYNPRKVDSGKKITASDGLQSLLLALIYRFKPLHELRKQHRKTETGEIIEKNHRLKKNLLLFTLFIAFAVRLLTALPGLDTTESTFTRPDSSTYIQPALALLENGRYWTEPNSGIPATLRPPGTSVFLAFVFAVFNKSTAAASITFCLISSLIAIPLFKCGRTLAEALNIGKRKAIVAGFISSLLWALNLTAIAHAPLLLSDTLYTFVAAWQTFFFIRFYRHERLLDAWTAVGLAALATLIRPTSLLWILPACVMILFYPSKSFRKRLIGIAGSILLFVAVLLPWTSRNNQSGAGLTIDTNSGNSLFYHNCAALISKVKGISAEDLREKWREEAKNEFRSDPDFYSKKKNREAYKISRAKELISRYPLTYISLHFQPMMFAPDAPTFLENLGKTHSGRGTLDVLRRKGIIAAVSHYFEGRFALLLLISPLLLIAGSTYFFAVVTFVVRLKNKDWYLVLMLVPGLLFYYTVLPGPITMPRYHLPALPMICAMAGYSMYLFYDRFRSKCGN